eukprot:350207-Chlamydomonas_euryale.AAC.3
MDGWVGGRTGGRGGREGGRLDIFLLSSHIDRDGLCRRDVKITYRRYRRSRISLLSSHVGRQTSVEPRRLVRCSARSLRRDQKQPPPACPVARALNNPCHASSPPLPRCFLAPSSQVLKCVLADVRRVVCVSHTSKENTVLRACLPPAHVLVIPNGAMSSRCRWWWWWWYYHVYACRPHTYWSFPTVQCLVAAGGGGGGGGGGSGCGGGIVDVVVIAGDGCEVGGVRGSVVISLLLLSSEPFRCCCCRQSHFAAAAVVRAISLLLLSSEPRHCMFLARLCACILCSLYLHVLARCAVVLARYAGRNQGNGLGRRDL